MPTYTDNLNLYKPSRLDADIEVDTSLAQNFQNIEDKLGVALVKDGKTYTDLNERLDDVESIANAAYVKYNAKLLGVKGDSSTDDTNAVQEAVNDIHNAGGGALFFPAGTYRIREISMRSNVSFIGVPQDTRIRALEPTLWNTSRNIENVLIKDFVVDAAFTGEDTIGGVVDLYDDSYTKENIIIDGLVTRNYPRNSTRLRNFNNSVIKNCRFIDSFGDGIRFRESENIVIEHNYIKGCRFGIISFGNVDYAEVSNNRVYDSRLTGIHFQASTNRSAISDNHVKGSNADFDSGRYHICLLTSSNFNTVKGNRCNLGDGYAEFAIYIQGSTMQNFITGNDLVDAGRDGGISDSGTETKIADDNRITYSELNAAEKRLAGVTEWNEAGYTGSGVKVAVIDAEADDSLWFFDGKVQSVGHVYSEDVTDSHGQRVASIVHDVARNADIYVLPRKGSDGSSYGAYGDSLQWCLDNNIDIINTSLVGTTDYVTLEEQCRDAGILLLTSAGNTGTDGGDNTLGTFAKQPHWWSVGYIRLVEGEIIEQQPYSSYGEELDIVNFGTQMQFWWYDNDYSAGIARSSGSSYSCPFTAGMMALYIEKFQADNGRKPTVSEMENYMKNNCVDMGDPGHDIYYGHGRFVLPSI